MQSLFLGFITRGGGGGEFIFSIVYFSCFENNIHWASVYGVFVSQLVRYAAACFKYQDFVDRGKDYCQKLPQSEACTETKKLYGRHYDLVDPYNMVVS